MLTVALERLTGGSVVRDRMRSFLLIESGEAVDVMSGNMMVEGWHRREFSGSRI
jgi:hypothetical protein